MKRDPITIQHHAIRVFADCKIQSGEPGTPEYVPLGERGGEYCLDAPFLLPSGSTGHVYPGSTMPAANTIFRPEE